MENLKLAKEKVMVDKKEIKQLISIADKKVTNYKARAVERSKPGKGDSAKILHAHSFDIDEVKYSFLAISHIRWIKCTDTVCFNFFINKDGYNNIVRSSLLIKDKDGELIERGNRAFKKRLRKGTFAGRDDAQYDKMAQPGETSSEAKVRHSS